MRELVFLLEERSASAFLERLLPRLLDEHTLFKLIPFEGKQDLERQMARRIRAYQNPHARFIILHDKDGHSDCVRLKQSLLARCRESGRVDACLIRIACTELETFYLADLAAVEAALNVRNIAHQQGSRKFRNPDRLGNPSEELRKLTGGVYEKVAGSRALGMHLALDNVRSPSFKNLIQGIRKMEAQLPAPLHEPT